MAISFITGSPGAGKSYYLYHHIIEEAQKNPNQRYLIVVPEQFTMQTQKELVRMSPRHGILNIDILSFQRLAYRVFEEIGGYQEQILEETGKSFVLQKIAQENKSQLKILGGNLRKPGYIGEMKSLISEFMQYQVDENLMAKMLEDSKGRPQLNQKLEDIQIVYKKFCSYLEKRYITAEEILDVLYRRIEESENIRNSVIVLDGFTGFTPIQNKVIQKLLHLAIDIYVTVTLDSREELFGNEQQYGLFFMSRKLLENLSNMAREEKVEIKKPIRITSGEKCRYTDTPALEFLEKNLFRRKRKEYPEEPQEISLYAWKNPFTEVLQVVSKIQQLTREEGYRYRDIAIVTGDILLYKDYAATAFEEAKIPYFLDEKHSVFLNPFIEFVRAAVDVVVQNYSYESVFRYLRTGMSDLKDEEIDELENYVIALGIRGFKRWKTSWVRIYKGMDQTKILEINRLRELVLSELEELTLSLNVKGETILSYTTSLYHFIVKMKAQEKLYQRQKEFERQKKAAFVKEYEQIYEIVMKLLDKLADVLGDEVIELREYKAVLDAGLSEAEVGIIPPSTDQILIGDIERTRLKDVKVLFFLGINNGVVPKSDNGSGILSETDREYLAQKKIELAPTARENIYIQQFYLYLNMTKPSEKLYLSFCLTNAKGEAILPASLIYTIQKLYPRLRLIHEIPEEQPLEKLIRQPEDSLYYFIEGLRSAVLGEKDEQWEELYTWYLKDEKYANQVRKLVDAAFFRNPNDRISRAVAKALYGEVLENSASRLEKFATCAFAHFLEYGLQLEERAQYEFTAVDIGNIAHKALEWFSNRLKELNYSWKELSDEKRDQLIDESIEEVVHDYGNTVLHSTARNEYMIERVKRIMRRTVWGLQEQIRRSAFEPSSFEVSFSMLDHLDSVNIALSKEERMKLRGRIDRLDTYKEDNHIYVKVIDYKSGTKKFDLVELYHGLQLQLMIYMNAAVELEKKKNPQKEVEPAGVFYYQVQDPMVDAISGEQEEETKKRILKKLCVDGILQEDERIIKKMDETLETETKSDIIPVTYKKDGTISKTSDTVSKEQFSLLSEFVSKKVKDIGVSIVEGDTSVKPYRLKTDEACQYCKFKQICGFDERIDGYHYRRLKSFQKDEIWQAFLEELQGGAHGSNMDDTTKGSH